MRKYHSVYPKLKEMMKTIRTNNLPVYVCNIETTGLDPIKDKIIQIGATKCSFDGTVLIPEDNLNVYINPEISISEFTENFTGRTNEFYASQPTLEEVMPSVRDFMGNNPVIIGWTASGFTSKFLMQAGFMTGFMVYPKMNIDLVDIARSTIPVERSGMNYKFATISNICKVPVSTSADRPVSSHDAADDVFAYIDIFNKLYPSCITGNDTAKIIKSSYWEKSNFCRSIYFETDHGSVHIDANTDFFVEDTPGFFDTVDMDALSQTILTTCKAEQISDVVKLYYTNWKKNQKNQKRWVKKMANVPKKNKQVIVDQTCSAVFTFNDGKFFSDHDARLVEVSTQGALIISKHDIDVNALHHIESVVNGGQGQMIPLAGEVNCSKRLNGKTCYFLKFHGYNSQAQRYINIHSAKSTGRRKIPSSKGEKR